MGWREEVAKYLNLFLQILPYPTCLDLWDCSRRKNLVLTKLVAERILFFFFLDQDVNP